MQLEPYLFINSTFFNKALLLIIFVLSIWWGISVYSNDKKNRANQLFFLMSILLCIWPLFGYLTYFAKQSDISLFWVKWAYATVSMFLCVFYFFFLYFLKEERKFKIFNIFILTTSSLFVIISFFTNGIVRQIEIQKIGVKPYFGPMSYLYYVYAFIVFIFIFYRFYKNYTISSKEEKLKIQYFFIGTFIFIFLATTFDIIIPILQKSYEFHQFGNYAGIIFLGFTAYAIVKHHLFGIKIILSEVFSGLIVIVLFIDFLLSESITEYILKGLLFFGSSIFSYLMIRSMVREVKQREKLQRAHHQLESAYQKLERLDQAKSEFLSIATHQLRSPLTVTIDAISIILDGELGQLNFKQRKYLKEVFHRARKMVEVVNNFLNLSRLELGRMKFNFQKTNLKELLEETIDNLACQEEAKKKGLKFIYYPPKEPLQPVIVDQFQIQQVMQNFITNAFHYTNQGEIEVKLYQKNHSVVFSVRDTGMGLTSDEKEVIFEKFRRGKRAQNQYTEGSGIGLYLATQIIKAHHGRLWVESKGENQGSTFYFSLPKMRDEK